MACGRSAESPHSERLNPACSLSALGFEEDVVIPTLDGDLTDAKVMRTVGTSSFSRYGFVFVTGIDGGYLEPVEDETNGIYGRVADWAIMRGTESIFVKYRYPGNLEESVEDALSGAAYLKQRGATQFVVMGWSFGGAVMIHTSIALENVLLSVGFSPQAQYTESVVEFSNQKLLLFHSYDDENVPYDASPDILSRAPEGIEKLLVSLNGASHNLRGTQAEIDPVVFEWIGKVIPEVQPGKCLFS